MPKRQTESKSSKKSQSRGQGRMAAKFLANAESHWRGVQDRLASRQAAVDRKPQKHLIPQDTLDFLAHLYREPDLSIPGTLGVREAGDFARSVSRALRQAYQEGCEQGYLEGRVVELSARRAAADLRHIRKRQRKVTVFGAKMTLDERDKTILQKVQALKKQLGATEAEEVVAEEAGMTDRRVRSIVLEQTVAPDYLSLVRIVGETEAANRVIKKYGVDRLGNPSDVRRAAIRKMLPKLRLRTAPETQ